MIRLRTHAIAVSVMSSANTTVRPDPRIPLGKSATLAKAKSDLVVIRNSLTLIPAVLCREVTLLR